jgi:predicted Rossmann fold nucleotide-binding protein DprA/Smf involved in DNA uptake
MLLRDPTTIAWQDRILWAHGNAALLSQSLEALFCSKACPGAKIIEAMDTAQRWRREKRAVISGFHTPVEKECLRVFLRGPQLIVICPARGLDPFQLPKDWMAKYQRDELLLISPFAASIRRPTRETAELRTRLVLALATSHTIVHATPGGFIQNLTESKTSTFSTRKRQ